MRQKNISRCILILTLTNLFFIIPYHFSKIETKKENVFDLHIQAPISNLSIILIIGDGMGYEHIKLGRLVELGENNSFYFENLPYNANVSTYSADSLITDSAAAATAIATGFKTNNGMLSILPNLASIDTILELAQSENKSTGVVTTTSITHATPAAFMTHVSSRSSTSEISRQIVEESDVDIILGGGRSFFSENQITELESKGYTYVENNSMLMESNSSKIIGLFADDHLPYEISRDPNVVPSLYNMTKKAIERLSVNNNGFFLMIEGGRIDHAAHANDKVNVALETIEFDLAVEYAINFSAQRDNTLLIVTADHETGGLNVLSNTLNDILPSFIDSYEEKKTLRIERANNVSVSWLTTSHTATNVLIYMLNPKSNDLENKTLIDNTEIFNVMYSFLNFNDEKPNNGGSNTPETVISGYHPLIVLSIVISVILITKNKKNSRNI